jgi:DNA primase
MEKGITDSVVEEIKQRIDLADLIASYGIAIRTAGASKKACCPFHNEKTPSFNINDSRGYYHCFGCGESGDAIKFVQKMDGLTFIEAVKKLASQCGVEIKEQSDPKAGRRKRLYALMADIAAFYRRCLLKTKEASMAREYLASRDLGESEQEAWTIGYAPVGASNIRKWAAKYGYTDEELEEAGIIRAPTSPSDTGYHRFSGRLMFTIRDKQGRVVGFSGRQLVEDKRSGKYVNSPETPIFKKSSVLFGFDKASVQIAKSPRHEVIVCEGQIDCIRLHSAGFTTAVAGQGTAFTEEHVKMLKRVTDSAVLVYDDDAAGSKAAVKSARLLLASEIPVRVVSLPGGNDPDSFLRANPPEKFASLLESAESIVSFQIRAERAKETNPNGMDAVNRVVRALIETIASSANAVLRASMVAECAKALNIPEAALSEELEKFRALPSSRKILSPKIEEERESEEREDVAKEEKVSAPIKGIDAAKAIAPPPLEIAFCAFLLENEISDERGKIESMLSENVPFECLSHPFSVSFVEMWKKASSSSEDEFSLWSDTLSGEERNFLDIVLAEQIKAQATTMEVVDEMKEFVRRLWQEHLKRRRATLSASSDASVARERISLTVDIKRVTSARWPDLKVMIKSLKQNLNNQTK